MEQERIFISKTAVDAAYATISDALAALSKRKLPAPVTLELDTGIYHEKLDIRIPDITIEGREGSDPSQTVISYDDYAYFIMPDGIKRGTFRSYTLFVNAPRITLRNLTVENASGPSPVCGQGIALYADGDSFFCENCRLIGKQDTLFVAPLPEKEYEPGGFRGPGEFAPRTLTHQRYKNCYICGDVDFIFGGGCAVFEDCRIHSLIRDPAQEIQGYVTAPSTPEGLDYGFIFSHCRFTGECPAHSVYLGRPWRDHAQAVFLNCTYDAHIHPDGFHDWNKPQARALVNFAEYACVSNDPGLKKDTPPKRAPFVRQLTEAEAKKYQISL